MIQNPAYYRDLLNQILHEDDDDDIPNPPSRSEIKRQQFLRNHKSVKFFCGLDDDEENVVFTTDKIAYPLSDGHTVMYLVARTYNSTVIASVQPTYSEHDHPYHSPDAYVYEEIEKLWTFLGFDVKILGILDEPGNLYFDADISPETEEIWRKIAKKQTNNA
jgi:hypothetical protein